MINNIYKYINKLNFFSLIFLVTLINLLICFIASFLSNYFTGKSLNEGVNGFLNTQEEFVLVVIIAPLFETLIFQYLIIDFFSKKMQLKFACFISALTFALQHTYNLFYFVFALFMGIILAFLYVIGHKKNKGFVLVLITHFLYNLIVFAIKNIQ